jgi:hypothetical protein
MNAGRILVGKPDGEKGPLDIGKRIILRWIIER